jgi:filamentous hemagglutinin
MTMNVQTGRATLAFFMTGMLLTVANAQTPPLPVPATNAPLVSSGTANYQTNGQAGTITQGSDRAVLNWESFNIGKGHSVEFKQPGANSAALNLIHGGTPSEIQGALKANGQIYLINRNGIMFMNDAQVNVGSLIASTLNITPDRFNSSILTANPGDGALSAAFAKDGVAGSVTVDQGALITAAKNGRIILLGSNVTNSGMLQTNNGQVLIAAGDKVYLAGSDDPSLRGLLVEVDVERQPANEDGTIPKPLNGNVTNIGHIIAERGNATLAGLTVNQRGKISATAAVNANGSIRLLARDTAIKDPNIGSDGFKLAASVGGSVEIARGSVTEILPDLNDTSTIDGSGLFQRSKVEIFGKTIKHEGVIKAPNGEVTLTARLNPTSIDPASSFDPVKLRNESLVYLAEGSVIDVSGTATTLLPMSRNQLEVELRGDELKDFPLQRQGILRGAKVNIDISRGLQLADVSKQIAAVKQGIGELTSEGGSVKVLSEGDVVMKRGSTIDVSGGKIAYEAGFITTTKLFSKTQNKVYDISDAPADVIYDSILGVVQVRNSKGEIVKNTTTVGFTEFREGFTQGRNGGELTFKAHGLSLDGTLKGQSQPGQYQRNVGQVPLGGALQVLDFNLGNAEGELLHDVAFSNLGSQVNISFGEPVAVDKPLTMPIDFLTDGGFNRVSFRRTGKITVPEGVSLFVAPGSAVISGSSDSVVARNGITLQGREVAINGKISAPAGDIILSTGALPQGLKNTGDVFLLQGDVSLGENAELSTRGLWVNDRVVVLNNQSPTGAALINAGSITLTSGRAISIGGNSALNGTPALIDVSGGGWVDAKGNLKGGNGGNLAVFGLGTVEFNSTILGYAINQGGSFSFDAPNFNIVSGSIPRDARGNPVFSGTSTAEFNTVIVPSEFFSVFGFTRYSLKAYDEGNGASGLLVNPETNVALVAPYIQPNVSFRLQPTGTDIYSFSSVESLTEIRKPASLALSTGLLGDVTVGTNASISTDPLAAVNLSSNNNIYVDGTVSVPSGLLSLKLGARSLDGNFKPGQAIWLGQNARLLSPGIGREELNPIFKKGEILKGGRITLAADLGYVIAQAGSLIDISGSSGEFDVLSPGGTQYERRRFAGDAGSFAVTAAEGIYLNGRLAASKGEGAGSFGGHLLISLDTSKRSDDASTFDFGFPVGERQIIVRAGNPVELPPEFEFGKSIPLDFNGKAILFGGQLQQAGFDSLALNTAFNPYSTSTATGVMGGKIVLEPRTTLLARHSISLDAPLISSGSGSVIEANYVRMGSSDPAAQDLIAGFAPTAGEGSLRVNAKLIDLVGTSIIQDTGLVSLVSDGDIRARGIVPSNANPTTNNKEPRGEFSLVGDLELEARQIYPSTLTHFELATTEGVIRTKQRGAPSEVLSAGGDLKLTAKSIDHGGSILAPLGQITLRTIEPDGTIRIDAGGVLSVSANGQTIPFGKTENGRDWVYELSGAGVSRFNNPREKSIVLSADKIDLQVGSTIDLRGGGDLYAYEWVPGPGGSKDFLSNQLDGNATGYFAILPGLGSGYAPHDPQYYQGSEIKPGDSVYLAGSPGIPAGRYPLLPARYALLPGAYLIKAEKNYNDLLPSQRAQLRDGTPVVAGYFTQTDVDDVGRRFSGFSILAKDAVRARAEYRESFANKFFTDRAIANDAIVSRLPTDSGRLALSAKTELGINGSLLTVAPEKGRGAEVDIAASNIVIQDSSSAVAAPGFVNLVASDLVGLGAESLLIGGVRKATDTGVEVQVVANQIELRNSSASALTNAEIIFAANEQITLKQGSVLEAKGKRPSRSDDLTMSFARRDIDGDGISTAGGTVLRASAGDGVNISQDIAIDRSIGTIVIEEGARLSAERSLALDATNNTSFKGDLALGNNTQLSLSAGRITFGDSDGAVDGLVIRDDQLSQFEQLASLTLRSYSSVDFRGDVSFGTLDEQGKPRLAKFIVDTAAIMGFGSDTQRVLITTGGFQFVNTTNSGVLEGSEGTGQFAINSDRIVIGEGDKFISGFTKTTFASQGEIAVAEVGKLSVQNDLTLSAYRVTALKRSDQSITSSGSFVIDRAANAVAPSTRVDLGGKLALSGKDILQQGEIFLPGGIVSLAATGTDGNLILDTGSITSVAGAERVFDGKSIFVSGGKVSLISNTGDVQIRSGGAEGGEPARISVAGSDRGGDAGALSIAAAEGRVSILGSIAGAAAEGYESGQFSLDTGIVNSDPTQTVNNFASVNEKLNEGGFNRARILRLRDGDLTIAPTDVASSKQIQIVVDAGKIEIAGTVESNSSRGGRIELWARDNLTLAATGRLIAGGGESGGRPAKILLASRNGQIDLVKDGQVIFNPGGASTGELTLRAPRTSRGNDLAVNPVQSTLTGARDIIVEGVKVYSATSIGGPDPTSEGGNLSLGVNGVGDDLLFRETKTFGEAASAITSRLFGSDDGRVQIRPGIEVRSEGDLTLASSWNLREMYSVPAVDRSGNPVIDEFGNLVFEAPIAAWRYNDAPINLTLVAKGNINFGDPTFAPRLRDAPVALLNDGFDSANIGSSVLVSGHSASYRFVAGADLASASPSKVALDAAGDVVLARHKVIRTGDGEIDISASRDLTILAVARPGNGADFFDATSSIYSAGRPTKSEDFTELKDNFPTKGITETANYPTGGGDILVRVGGNVNGARTQQIATEWLQRSGQINPDGTIRVRAGGEALNTTWWVDYSKFQQNLGTLGGGDVTVIAGGDIDNLSVAIPTTGRLGGQPDKPIAPNNLVVLGGGDLRVDTGRDIRSGFFYVAKGAGDIRADGSILSGRTAIDTNPNGAPGEIYSVLAVNNARISLTALGDVGLEAVFNPTVIGQETRVTAPRRSSYFTFGEDSGVFGTSVGGSVKVLNQYSILSSSIRTAVFSDDSGSDLLGTYPSLVRFSAPQGDIDISNGFNIYPSNKGGLELFAENNIRVGGDKSINLSDADPAVLINPVRPSSSINETLGALNVVGGLTATHGETPIYLSADGANQDPVRIIANDGSISGGQYYLAKNARIVAGLDVQDLKLTAQNLRETDTTLVKSGRDLFFTTPIDPNTGLPISNNAGFEIAGPGNLLIQSGRNLDFGSSTGVVSIANRANRALPLEGANITIVAGVPDAPNYADFIGKYLDPQNSAKPRSYLNGKAWADFIRVTLEDSSLSDTAAFERYGRRQGEANSELLIGYVKALTNNSGDLNADQAWLQFKQLPVDQQRPLIEQVFFSELKFSGRAQALAGTPAYDRGFEAISTLFPGESYKGDLSLLFSQIKTESGGDINLFVPGGKVNAGQTSQGGNSSLNKGDDQLGIVAQDFGNVRAFTRGNFEVNESRVFTLRGGDILMWSSKGDIDAGRGAKTALSAPAPVLITLPNGQTIFKVLAVRGSGIRGILTDTDVAPGDVDLIAPEGVVNAGDAGIGSAGNITIAAVEVRGAGNIDIGGKATGVPTVDTGGLNAGVAGASNSSQDATKSTDEMTKKIAESTQLSDSLKQAFKPTFITVEVIGLGEEEDEEEKKKKGTSNKTETKSGDN